MMRRWLSCGGLAAFWLVQGQPVADGIAAYRAGQWQTAYAAFEQQAATAGENASSELRWNLALAALRVQRSADAEAAVQPWLTGEHAARRADAEFVTAMASFLRAERAAQAAQLPDAEPMAFAMAVAAMQRAEAGFQRAAAARGEWPAAVRNAERAHARLLELQKLRDAAKPDQAKAEPEPKPVPPPPPKTQPTPEEAPSSLPDAPLSAAELAQLAQRVARRERDKRSSRQRQRAAATAAGERGW